MSHRKTTFKSQAALLRNSFAAHGMSLPQGEALELVARLNGHPSWNVAKLAERSAPAEVPSKLKFQIWTAVHRHRHGEDLFYFTHQPSDQDVIDRIEECSSYEPENDESFEILGVESFDVDVPELLAQEASRKLSPALIGVYEVNMSELLDYEVPDSVPEWAWVLSIAAFHHRGNGVEAGVWEFMVHADKLRAALDSVPASLRPSVDRALLHGAVWVMFHQG